jgi:hypothetical protein
MLPDVRMEIWDLIAMLNPPGDIHTALRTPRRVFSVQGPVRTA